MNANAADPICKAPPSSHEQDAARGYQPRELVLLGGGLAHLNVLSSLPNPQLSGVRITLVAHNPRTVLPNLLPAFVAGDQLLDEVAIPLEPLVRKGGIRWLPRQIRKLDASTKTLLLDDGSTQTYDWLSINPGLVQNREQIDKDIPGARENGLFVHPLETFASLWPRVCEMGASRPLRISIIGTGPAAMELALAVRKRLRDASVTLIAGDTATSAANPLEQRLHQALRAQRITVLFDTALSISASVVQLGCGAGLACDVPMIAIEGQTPTWLQHSGLALEPEGHVRTDAYQRSTSHPQVFAALDESPALSRNLAASIAGQTLQPEMKPSPTLQLLFAGTSHAIGKWGPYSAQGRWVGWLKSWHDRRTLARYTEAAS